MKKTLTVVTIIVIFSIYKISFAVLVGNFCTGGDINCQTNFVNQQNEQKHQQTETFLNQFHQENHDFIEAIIDVCGGERPDDNWINCVTTSETEIRQKIADDATNIADQTLESEDVNNIQELNTRISKDSAGVGVNQNCGLASSTPNNNHDAIQKFHINSTNWISCVKPVLDNIEMEERITKEVLEKLGSHASTTDVKTNQTITPIIKKPIIEKVKQNLINIATSTFSTSTNRDRQNITVSTTTKDITQTHRNWWQKILSWFWR